MSSKALVLRMEGIKLVTSNLELVKSVRKEDAKVEVLGDDELDKENFDIGAY